MEETAWCPDCQKSVPVNTIKTVPDDKGNVEVIKLCGECQLTLSKVKKSGETQQLTPEDQGRNKTELTEEDTCVFGVILGNFNTVLLYKNKKESKEWGIKPEGWGRPGGVKKPGETEVEALFREVEEETGFWVEVEQETRHAERKGNHLDVSFICHVYGGKQKSRCNWFPLDSLPRSTYHSHRDVILLLARKQEESLKGGRK